MHVLAAIIDRQTLQGPAFRSCGGSPSLLMSLRLRSYIHRCRIISTPPGLIYIIQSIQFQRAHRDERMVISSRTTNYHYMNRVSFPLRLTPTNREPGARFAALWPTLVLSPGLDAAIIPRGVLITMQKGPNMPLPGRSVELGALSVRSIIRNVLKLTAFFLGADLCVLMSLCMTCNFAASAGLVDVVRWFMLWVNV